MAWLLGFIDLRELLVNLHVAPGLGNALGMLYNARVGKMPLVVTAGQQDSRMLVREPILSYDLVSMAQPLVKWAVQVQHVEELPVIVPRAFKVAQDAPRGPVFLALPSNVIDQQADLRLPGPSAAYRRNRPDPEGVAAAAALLARAQQPVIICGDGVAASQAQTELVQVAEQLGAHVWNTVIVGALNFPNTHPQYRGELPGEHASSALQRFASLARGQGPTRCAFADALRERSIHWALVLDLPGVQRVVSRLTACGWVPSFSARDGLTVLRTAKR